MSWITDFAGKAEELLNKIDQNAATVIQEAKAANVSSKEQLNEVITQNDSSLER